MSKKFCPNCNEEVTYLNYSRVSYQNGDYDIENDDYIIDSNSRDTNDDLITHLCPECEKEVDPEYLLNEEEMETKNMIV